MTEREEEKISLQDREEEEFENLNEFLSGIGPGYTVLIRREEPGWCKGLLEEREIDNTDKPIDIMYLIKTWGGRKLRLKFRRPQGTWMKHRDIELYSYPPLVWGQPIAQVKEQNPHINTYQENPQQQQISPLPQLPPAPVAVPQSDTKKEMLEMLQMMQQMRAADMQAMAALIERNRSEGPDPYKMMSAAFGMFSHMQQTIKASIAGETPSTGDDEVLSLLGKLTEVFTTQSRPDAPPKVTAPVGASYAPNARPLYEQLSALNPREALDTFRLAVNTMSHEKKAETMGELINSIDQIGGTELLLNSLEKRGILGVEEDETGSEMDSSDAAVEDTGGQP